MRGGCEEEFLLKRRFLSFSLPERKGRKEAGERAARSLGSLPFFIFSPPRRHSCICTKSRNHGERKAISNLLWRVHAHRFKAKNRAVSKTHCCLGTASNRVLSSKSAHLAARCRKSYGLHNAYERVSFHTSSILLLIGGCSAVAFALLRKNT